MKLIHFWPIQKYFTWCLHQHWLFQRVADDHWHPWSWQWQTSKFQSWLVYRDLWQPRRVRNGLAFPYENKDKNGHFIFDQFWYDGSKWINGILLLKLIWPTVRKTFVIRCWRPRICKTFEITWTIYSNSERSEQFLVTECFLTCSWRFLRYNKLKQLEFKLEKIIGI